MNTLGEKFAELRKSHNFTQENIASQLKIDVRTLRDIENDIRLPTFDKIVGLAKILKIEIIDIVNYKQTDKSLKINKVYTPEDHIIDNNADNIPKRIEQILESYHSQIDLLKSQIEDKNFIIKLLKKKLKN